MITAEKNSSSIRRAGHRCGGVFFLKVSLLIASAFGSSLTSSAQTVDMTKIVYRRVDPNVSPSSVEAKPVTIYRAGEKYARVEFAPEPAEKRHVLKITREPDAWLINLLERTADHYLDPGPTFNARLPILWTPRPPGEPNPDDKFMELEYGNEEAFFRQNHTDKASARQIEGKECTGLTIKSGGRSVTLFSDAQTGKPVQLERTKGDKLEMALRYVAYETSLPFDPSLFEPPAELNISEAKIPRPPPPAGK